MPEIKKSVPQKNPTTTRSSGAPTKSILSEAVDVSEVSSPHDRIVIYGVNRVGKTTLACQFPKPLLLLGFEPTATGGAKSVTGVKGVKFLRVESSQRARDIAVELRGQSLYKTVVIDSATSLQDIALKEILGLAEIPDMLKWGTATLKDYMARSEITREILRMYLNLDCHLVITAKEKDHNPPKEGKPEIVQGVQQESFFSVNLGGETAGWLQDACDAVCQMTIQKEMLSKEVPDTSNPGKKKTVYRETGNNIHRLRLKYHPNYAAGLRNPDPDKVPEYLDLPTYEKLKAIIDGK